MDIAIETRRRALNQLSCCRDLIWERFPIQISQIALLDHHLELRRLRCNFVDTKCT